MDDRAVRTRSSSAATGVGDEAESKRLRDMMTDFDNLKVAAAVGITQDPAWYCWEGVVVVGLFPHPADNTAWAVGLELRTSMLVVVPMATSDEGIAPVDHVRSLDNSQRWASKITHAEAVAGDHGLENVGKAKVEFCVDLHYRANSLLGVDVGGMYQIWDLRCGAEMLQGRFTYGDCYVRMNAICHTPDWIIGATCLDDDGCTSTIFAVNIGSNEQAPPLTVNVTGIRHLSLDAENPKIAWVATDSGPFFIDTRFPHPMWAILPGGRWIEALGIVDDMGTTLEVGRYVARFEQCIKDVAYRKAMLDGSTCAPEKCGDLEDSPVVCTAKRIAEDLQLAKHFNTKRYRVLDADVRPHYLQTAPDGQLIAIGEACFSWTSMHDMKIVPGRLGGLLCGAFVPGGLVFIHENRKIYMVQAPWAERSTEQPDFAEKLIARAFDASVTTTTRISDAPNVDSNHMVVAVSDTTVLVHAADDGIYRFDIDNDTVPPRIIDLDAYPRWMPPTGVDIGELDALRAANTK